MTSFLYFAYGSNMLTERLAARCPSAEPMGAAVATGYSVAFSKLSTVDGSGKAALVACRDQEVHGALFRVGLHERRNLDDHEGSGYRRVDDFQVVSIVGRMPMIAAAYFAKETVEGLRPFDWYKALAIAGARQHSLPEVHLNALAAATHDEDPLPQRKTRLEALQALKCAGITDCNEVLRAPGVG